MKITNKAATVMFTGKSAQALGAQYLKDHLKPGRGASWLMKQSAHINKSLAQISQASRETLRRLDILRTGHDVLKANQTIYSTLQGGY